MATVEEVARHCAGITGTNDDLLLIATWVNQRWKEVANHNTLRELRRTGELNTQGVYSTGTVSVTRGSHTVSGTGTGWTNALIGQYFRTRAVWHRIIAVPSATTLTLASEFSDVTVSDGGYKIAQREYRLAPNIRKLSPVWVHMRLRRPLQLVSREGIDMMIPSRYSTNDVPQYVNEVEPDVDGVKRVEIYPYTNSVELIGYVYWREPYDLGLHDQLPAFIDIESFREGVMVDVMRHKMFMLMEDGKERASELMRNEYQAAMTRWQNTHRVRVLSQDDALDDLEFTVSRTGRKPTWGHGDREVIADAYSQVWYGNRV